eukprot:TRINITY_DN1357_c0_g1_i4.p1 TRINITY_DN1357_c0_g1~~TRINITY_DN1357_c0_g1_i4.p1  ORF type:complete len:121 (+),score=9.66 TRINITY_DN1357_c0_g1_i4:462-824(+)
MFLIAPLSCCLAVVVVSFFRIGNKPALCVFSVQVGKYDATAISGYGIITFVRFPGPSVPRCWFLSNIFFSFFCPVLFAFRLFAYCCSPCSSCRPSWFVQAFLPAEHHNCWGSCAKRKLLP